MSREALPKLADGGGLPDSAVDGDQGARAGNPEPFSGDSQSPPSGGTTIGDANTDTNDAEAEDWEAPDASTGDANKEILAGDLHRPFRPPHTDPRPALGRSAGIGDTNEEHMGEAASGGDLSSTSTPRSAHQRARGNTIGASHTSDDGEAALNEALEQGIRELKPLFRSIEESSSSEHSPMPGATTMAQEEEILETPSAPTDLGSANADMGDPHGVVPNPADTVMDTSEPGEEVLSNSEFPEVDEL